MTDKLIDSQLKLLRVYLLERKLQLLACSANKLTAYNVVVTQYYFQNHGADL